MNILRHKSWHLYNEDNLIRVRKDEAEAKEREDRQKQRQKEVDGERRLALLREKRGIKGDGEGETIKGDGEYQESTSHINERTPEYTADSLASVAAAHREDPLAAVQPLSAEELRRRHIHLFAEEEAASQHRANVDRQREERAKKEQEDRSTTMYLDQGLHKDGEVSTPWYMYSGKTRHLLEDRLESSTDRRDSRKSRSEKKTKRSGSDEEDPEEEGRRRHKHHRRKHYTELSKDELRQRDDRRKEHLDPLNVVRRATALREAKEDADTKHSHQSRSSRPRESQRRNDNNKNEDPWAKLRQERLERELEERQRLQALAAKDPNWKSAPAFGVPSNVSVAPSSGSRTTKPKYNSQFNPDIVDRLDTQREAFQRRRK